MSEYTELAALRDVVLEESWILGVIASPTRLSFTADFVMTVAHSRYSPPSPDEVFSYFRGEMIFSGVSALSWTAQGDPPAIDAAGTVDWGHIDSMSFEGHHFQLEGDWGRIEVTALEVRIVPTPTLNR